jgi:hypothetical protein
MKLVLAQEGSGDDRVVTITEKLLKPLEATG